MTTLSTRDLDFERIFEPVQMKSHPRCVIRDALTEHCERLPTLSAVQIKAVIEAAQTEHAFGASTAKAIAEGKKVAQRIVEKMEAIRTRFGTKPDDAA